jgi:hypothetical protein
MQDGIYDAIKVPGSEQWGPSTGGHIQLRVLIAIKDQGVWPSDLIFSPDSAHFSQDRLKAMGWDGAVHPKGHEWEGFPDLKSIDGANPGANKGQTSKRFKVRVKSDNYQGSVQQKVEVFTGAAPIEEFTPEKRVTAAAQLGAMLAAPRPPRKPRQTGPNAGGYDGPDDDYYR